MNKKILLGVAMLVVIVLGIVSYILFSKRSVEYGKSSYTHQDNIITERVTYKIDNVDFTLDLNKINKTASVDTTMTIGDDEEYTEMGGSRVAMVPFTVNLACSLYNSVFMDPEKLKELKSYAGTDEKPETRELLKVIEGYTFSSFQMKFTDKETNEKIAECSGNGGTENLVFKAYREYDPKTSFSGSVIGDLSK